MTSALRLNTHATRCGCHPSVADYQLRYAAPRLRAGTVKVITLALCCGASFADELTIAQVHAIAKDTDE